MKPNLATISYQGIVATIWSGKPLQKKQAYRFIIFCYGLPSHPYQHHPAKVERLIEEGYVLVYPKYRGTWESKGTMSWENCVSSIIQTVRAIKTGHAKEIYAGKRIEWSTKDIALVGGSFGGSIALVAGAKSKEIHKIIAVAAPINWRDHSRIRGERSEPIVELYDTIQQGWKPLWRISSRKEWLRLAHGTADINPIDYVSILKKKNVLLIHGINDTTVSPTRSKIMHHLLSAGPGQHKLILLKKTGHLGNDAVGLPQVIEDVLSFLH